MGRELHMACGLRTMENSRFARHEWVVPRPGLPAWICLDMPRPLPEQIDIPFAVPFTHGCVSPPMSWAMTWALLLDLIEKSGDQIPRVQFWVDEYVAKADLSLVPRLQSLIQESGERFLHLDQSRSVQVVNRSRTISTHSSGCCKSSMRMTWIVAAT